MKITKMLANKKIAALVSVTTTVAIAGGAIALASNANEDVALETEPVVIEEVAEEAVDDSVIVATEDMVEEQTYDTSSEETQAVITEESGLECDGIVCCKLRLQIADCTLLGFVIKIYDRIAYVVVNVIQIYQSRCHPVPKHEIVQVFRQTWIDIAGVTVRARNAGKLPAEHESIL